MGVALVTMPQAKSGFFEKLRSRLNRGRSLFSLDLSRLFGRKLDEETLESIEEDLLMADAGVEATEWIVSHLRKRAAGDAGAEAALRAVLTELLEPLARPLEIPESTQPFIMLVVGVNGTGKTTTIGKLAHRFKESGRSVLLAAGDTFRAAAVEQLEEWGRRAGIPVIAQQAGADPAAVIHDALAAAQARGIDVVLADTAGRLHTATNLMEELKKIKRVVARFDENAPHEVLLVLDASQGQNALVQAKQFHEALGVTGLVLTKLDGTAKGGIALALARQLAIPIRFIAIGESIEDLDVFDAEDFTAALTGTSQA